MKIELEYVILNTEQKCSLGNGSAMTMFCKLTFHSDTQQTVSKLYRTLARGVIECV